MTPDIVTPVGDFGADVRFYLTQSPRQLPSRYLYDDLGSALFDAICRLPWYRVTRSESGLLTRHAAEILAAAGPPARLVELGGGNGEKLALLLSARQQGADAVSIDLVDISPAALDAAARTIASTGNVSVRTHRARYVTWLDAKAILDDAAPLRQDRTLTLFLGSNIGNFDPLAADVLLAKIRKTLRPGDAILLGVDLIKPTGDLLLAYDDPLGVTTAFNLNLLVRINRELGADFEIAGFRHQALWNSAESRIEMHLVSTRRQRVQVPGAGLDISLEQGETIWTESSYKYRPQDVQRTLTRCGFRNRAQWIDDDAGFALMFADVPAPCASVIG